MSPYFRIGKKVEATKYPLFYEFDVNHDGKTDEVYRDQFADGWNGNEKIYLGRPQSI